MDCRTLASVYLSSSCSIAAPVICLRSSNRMYAYKCDCKKKGSKKKNSFAECLTTTSTPRNIYCVNWWIVMATRNALNARSFRAPYCTSCACDIYNKLHVVRKDWRNVNALIAAVHGQSIVLDNFCTDQKVILDDHKQCSTDLVPKHCVQQRSKDLNDWLW